MKLIQSKFHILALEGANLAPKCTYPFYRRYYRWNSTVDIESGRRCQIKLSIKMIQSRARYKLVCSLPAYCVKLFTATLRTVWVTRQEIKAYLWVIFATRHALLYLGICGVKYHIFKAFNRHFELSRWHNFLIVRKYVCCFNFAYSRSSLPLHTILTDQFVLKVTQKDCRQ